MYTVLLTAELISVLVGLLGVWMISPAASLILGGALGAFACERAGVKR